MRARPAPRNRTSSTTASEQIFAPALSAQRQRNRAIRDHALASIALANATTPGESTSSTAPSIPLGIVPLQERTITALPVETRERFLSRLEGRVREAFELEAPAPTVGDDESDDEPTTRGVEALMGSGCGMCRGACCTRGSDHAFLGVDSLSRVRNEHRSYSAESLLATYVAHVPAEHFADSCVYHAVSGCTLPRTLRSNTCNRYRCGGLTQLRRELVSSQGTSAFIGVSDNQSLRALAFVTANGEPPIAHPVARPTARPIVPTDATGS